MGHEEVIIAMRAAVHAEGMDIPHCSNLLVTFEGLQLERRGQVGS